MQRVSGVTDALNALVEKVESWGEAFVLMLPNLVAALVALVASIIAGRLLGSAVYGGLQRMSSNESLNAFARKLVCFLGVVIGLIVALQILKLDKAATTFLAGAGLVGIALGFAFQDMSANFIAGVSMAIKRPFSPGDLIETNEEIGIVERIEMRTTVLRTPDGKLVRMPNRKIFEEAIINLSVTQRRRVDIDVGVAYSSDLDEVDSATREAIEQVVDRDASRGVEIYFKEFGDSSINLVARFWIPFAKKSDYFRARDQAIRAIKKIYDARGITIPFPSRTLELGEGFEEVLGETIKAAR